MRKLIYAINLTADGCCDHTKGLPGDEMYGYHTRLLQEADIFAYGRKTYELMVPYWPDVAKNDSGETEAENEFAQAFNAISKIIVFSRTLESAEGRNTVIVRTKLQDEIQKLKQEKGKNILTGGVSVPTQLIQLGLVDEYHFVIHPIFAGAGRRLLDDITLHDRSPLKLAASKTFKSGAVALHYLK